MKMLLMTEKYYLGDIKHPPVYIKLTIWYFQRAFACPRENAGGECTEPGEGGGEEQGEPKPLQRGPGEADHRGDKETVGAKQVCVNNVIRP